MYIRHMKRIGTYLTDTEIGELRVMSVKSGLSMAELIRRAVVDEYLKRIKGGGGV